MRETSKLIIDAEALENNIKFLKSFIGKKVRFSSVVKGNAYGHGISQFVPLLEKNGVDHFSVFSAAEAEEVLRCSSGDPTILIMGWLDNPDIEWAILNKVQFFVFEWERFLMTIDIAKKLKIKAYVHVEIETGLNRTGFDVSSIPHIANLLKQNKEWVVFQGLCTHYAGAESVANYLRIQRQIVNFNSAYKLFAKNGIRPKIKHTACSAATISYPKSRMDLVRIGILQYGFWPSKETMIDFFNHYKKQFHADPLKRVITWKSYIMSVKHVKSGEFIGYGTTYIAHQDMTVAVIPVGYAHGYSRSLSNQGRVLIRGSRVGVLGIVNMNLIVVEVTLFEGLKTGEEVILIGAQGNLNISVASFGELSEQLNYELLTRLSPYIPREVVNA